MVKVTLTTKVENAIEVGAGDALAFLTKEGVKLASGGPKALAALGVLLGAVDQELSAAQTGNIAAAIQDVKPVWADVKAFVAELGIKL
jgi:hypothetical protein